MNWLNSDRAMRRCRNPSNFLPMVGTPRRVPFITPVEGGRGVCHSATGREDALNLILVIFTTPVAVDEPYYKCINDDAPSVPSFNSFLVAQEDRKHMIANTFNSNPSSWTQTDITNLKTPQKKLFYFILNFLVTSWLWWITNPKCQGSALRLN